MGLWMQKFIQEKLNLFYTLILGLFGEMILIHFYALLFPINEIFYVINFVFASIGILMNWKSIQEIWNQKLSQWKEWKKPIQILSVILTVLILMQTSTKPYLIDNETYYIQTIKWLNEYGLVKGLANLHIFLGQNSGWHLLQSGFNFGFISNSLNGINGFLLFVTTLFSLNHLNEFYKSKLTMDLFLGLLPVMNLLFFQFLNIPSPDFPLFILSPIVFYLFYKNAPNYQGDFRLVFCLSLFLVLIKMTIVPILILPILLLFKHKICKENPFFISLGAIGLIAFTLKNYIISGYIFYPVDFLGNLVSPDWKIPTEVQQEFKPNKSVRLSHLTLEESAKLSNWQYFKEWLFEPGLMAIFNKLIIALFMIFPFYIYKNKTLFWLYIYALAQFFLLYFTSPQYRFFFPIIIGMLLYILAKLFLNRSQYLLQFLIPISLLPIFTLFIPLNLEKLKQAKNSATNTYSFHLENIIIPAKNSSSAFEFESIKEGNLRYYSPINQSNFYWPTGDGELPTAQKKMIESFKKHLKIRPQMRTENMKDGFYAEKLNE